MGLKMSLNKIVSDEFAVIVPALAETMDLATRALAEGTALAFVLIQKGVLTQAELDAAMNSTPALKESVESLRKLLGKNIGRWKPS